MADSTAGVVQRRRGRLIAGVTDLTDAENNYGGTVLGPTRQHLWRPIDRVAFVEANEWANQESEGVGGKRAALFTTVLRAWDHDAINTVFPSTDDSGAPDNRRTINYYVNDDSKARSGYLLSSKATRLLWIPEKPTIHQAVFLYAAGPMRDADVDIALSPGSLWGIPVMFIGFPAAVPSGAVYREGLVSDIASLAALA